MSDLPQLNRQTMTVPAPYPERVVQFGAGNFLRGFVDWIIEELNQHTPFASSVVVVKVTPGKYDELDAQDGLFYVHLEGIQNGAAVAETQLITCVSRTVYPYEDYAAYVALARQPEIRFLISNTTESGIQYQATDQATDQPPASFPAKLALFLYERYQYFGGAADKGCIILPTELIEANGTQLQKIVLRYAEQWGLPAGFADWVRQHNLFCNTLVDRIVSGFPQAQSAALFQKLGYTDSQLVMGEPYHSWVIEAPEALKQEFPVAQTNLNVQIVRDVQPYRETKVRILNGLHTSMALIGTLMGLQIVRECMEQAELAQFLQQTAHREILPSLDLPQAELQNFAEAVFDRFRNPSIQHRLLTIATNSSTKVKTRLLPSIQAYYGKSHQLPPRLVMVLAVWLRFYKGEWQGQPIALQDDPAVLQWFQEQWLAAPSHTALVQAVFQNSALWGSDLSQWAGLAEQVTHYLTTLDKIGIIALLQQMNE